MKKVHLDATRVSSKRRFGWLEHHSQCCLYPDGQLCAWLYLVVHRTIGGKHQVSLHSNVLPVQILCMHRKLSTASTQRVMPFIWTLPHSHSFIEKSLLKTPLNTGPTGSGKHAPVYSDSTSLSAFHRKVNSEKHFWPQIHQVVVSMQCPAGPTGEGHHRFWGIASQALSKPLEAIEEN